MGLAAKSRKGVRQQAPGLVSFRFQTAKKKARSRDSRGLSALESSVGIRIIELGGKTSR